MKYVLALMLMIGSTASFANEKKDEPTNTAKPDQREPMDESQRKMDAAIGKNHVGPTPTNKKAKKPFASKEEKAKDDTKSAY
ncbi:hypothetical protein [Bdellovibrio sp. HCB209]|uniref:hypothetical protein n=1 Tax=Bdellovibrio sp. HCB209 TaxID=3394354 RepID=UPI0039B4BC1E